MGEYRQSSSEAYDNYWQSWLEFLVTTSWKGSPCTNIYIESYTAILGATKLNKHGDSAAWRCIVRCCLGRLAEAWPKGKTLGARSYTITLFNMSKRGPRLTGQEAVLWGPKKVCGYSTNKNISMCYAVPSLLTHRTLGKPRAWRQLPTLGVQAAIEGCLPAGEWVWGALKASAKPKKYVKTK